MREATGNIWDLVQPTEAIVITTNGTVTKEGRGVMGRGIALEAKQKVKGIDKMLGHYLVSQGNHAWYLARAAEWSGGPQYGLICMPVKHQWHQDADPELIVRSAQEMVELANREQHIAGPDEWANIWMPRPGCGNGRLDWSLVKPLIEDILDDRFIAVTFDEG